MKTGSRRLVCAATVLVLNACTSLVTTEPQAITPQQVVLLSKQERNPAEIIEKLKRSDTVYTLSASQLVQLARDGVPEPVLDHMQRTHLIAIEREARRGGGLRSASAFVPAF